MTVLVQHQSHCGREGVTVMMLTAHGRCRNSWDYVLRHADTRGLGCSLIFQDLIALPEEEET